MRLALAHARLETLELVRYPAFLVPTLLFPALFFLAFVTPGADDRADLLLASFAGFAFLGVAFFQFGVGIAAERASPWELFVRTLPVAIWTRLAGRVASAVLFASASALLVVVVALTTTPASIGAAESGWLALGLLAGSLPFAFLGTAIGYLASPRSALPAANVLFLGLAYLGGFWTGPDRLPDALEWVSVALPTREWAEILWGAARGDPPRAAYWLGLAGWGIGFALLAAWAYRRDEGQRFR